MGTNVGTLVGFVLFFLSGIYSSFFVRRNQGVSVQGVIDRLLIAPLIQFSALLFSKLGIYQKAFEHLGNALTYDPTNYKVLQAAKPQGLHTDGRTAPIMHFESLKNYLFFLEKL